MQESQRPILPLVVLIILALIAMQAVDNLMPPDKLFSDWIGSLSALGLVRVVGKLAFVITAMFAIYRLWEMKASAVPAYFLCVFLWAVLLALKDCQLKLEGKANASWGIIILPPALFAIIPGLVGWGLSRTLKKFAQPDGAPKGGPTTPVGNSAATEGPPSVS
jgi:hypothetical protein